MKRIVGIIWVLVAGGLAFAIAFLTLPFYSLGPGPARQVEPLIAVEGASTYASAGRLIMTTIEFRRLTPIRALIAWLDPDEQIVNEERLFPGDISREEEERRSISQMDQSKIDATYVVLRGLGDYPKEHGRGALIEQTVDGCSADGELYPGDLVLRINDEPIGSVTEASRVIRAIPSGRALEFDVRPLGQERTQNVRLVRRPCGGQEESLVGVSMVDSFPFEVSIRSGDVGGPSAGLMWALGLHDLLTPGDLTDGRTIAGTGVLGLDGTVGPIGGIQEKVLAADAAEASVLLVPKGNMAEARTVEDPGVRLVSVASFDDALDFLERG
jgi:Lon-like protease